MNNPLSYREMELLLEFSDELDTLFDVGMTQEEDVKHQLEIAVKIIRDFFAKGGNREEICLLSLSILFRNHFLDYEVITNFVGTSEAIIEMYFNRLKEKGYIKNSLDELEKVQTVESEEMIIYPLRVYDCFIGMVMAEGKGFNLFHKKLIELFSRKVDTDIYSYNRYIIEQIKTRGIARINQILDAREPLSKKYEKVLEYLVETIEAFSGCIVISDEGNLKIIAGYQAQEDKSPFTQEQILNTAREVITGSQVNVFIKSSTLKISQGEVFTILLQPHNGGVEGVLLLHHRDFRPPHEEIALAYASLIDSSLHTERLYKVMFQNFINAMGTIIDTFDTYTSGHSRRVSLYSLALGKALGLSEIQMTKLKIASILHDIGKVGVDPAIIRKTDRLTDNEMDQIRNHSVFTGNILHGVFPLDLEDIDYLAMSHHEKEDGSGYPKGLTGDQIPLMAKIIAVADIFDALTSDRPYHKGRTREKAYKILQNDAERGKLSPHLVSLFMSDKVWQEMRHDFQILKINSAFQWFKNNILPPPQSLREEAERLKKCITGLINLGKKYEKNKEIRLEDLEGIPLEPSHKESLIQKENQKERRDYLNLIQGIKDDYYHKFNAVQENLDKEIRFSAGYWSENLFQELLSLFTELTDRGLNLFDPVSLHRDSIPEELYPHGEKNLLDFMEEMLSWSAGKKSLSGEYKTPLKTLLATGKQLESRMKGKEGITSRTN